MQWLLSINRRVVLLVLAGLLLTDLFIYVYTGAKFQDPADERMPSTDPATVMLWIEQVQKAGGFNVVFVGDSVVHGLAAGNSRETLPWYFAREIRQLLPGERVNVFNLAMAGGGPAETLLVLNTLRGAPIDLVIYDLNLGWFNRATPLEHRGLLELAGGCPPGFEPRQFGAGSGPGQGPALAEQWLKQRLLSHWKLYHNRVLWNYWLFGKPIRDKLPLAVRNPAVLFSNDDALDPEIRKLRANWRDKAGEFAPLPPEQRLGAAEIKPGNLQFQCYLAILELLNQRDIPAVFFTPPRNYELLGMMSAVDESGYRRDYDRLIAAAGEHGVPVLRYDHLLQPGYFHDMIHPGPAGNRVVARRLAGDLLAGGYLGVKKCEQ